MANDPHNLAFQTKKMLQELLTDRGLKPRHRYGQHFLIDRNLAEKLVAAADLRPSDCVLEVGAGTGSLTALLARSAGAVVAVEIDEHLADIAAERLATAANVTLVRGDALDSKSVLSGRVVAGVRQASAATAGALKLVANLPYDIATPLLMDILLSGLGFGCLCFTVQTEVADRILAEAGTADYGPVSIITRLLCTGRRICKVPPQAFWPMPKVFSTMVRLQARPAADIPVSHPSSFAAFVRRFFMHRRKTLAHLVKNMDDPGCLLHAIQHVGLDPTARPETLTVEQWVNFYQTALPESRR